MKRIKKKLKKMSTASKKAAHMKQPQKIDPGNDYASLLNIPGTNVRLKKIVAASDGLEKRPSSEDDSATECSTNYDRLNSSRSFDVSISSLDVFGPGSDDPHVDYPATKPDSSIEAENEFDYRAGEADQQERRLDNERDDSKFARTHFLHTDVPKIAPPPSDVPPTIAEGIAFVPETVEDLEEPFVVGPGSPLGQRSLFGCFRPCWTANA